MAHLLPTLKQQFFDGNGDPLVGGKIFTYNAGTATPLATYTDQTETTSNTNPIILDANGEADIWVGPNAYKFVVKDSTDVVLYTVDNVSHLSPASVTNSKIADNAISTAKIQDDAVTEDKILDAAVTEDKIADGAVTTDKIPDGELGLEKLDPNIDLHTLSRSLEVSISSPKAYSLSGNFRIVPQYPWTTPAKITDPSSLPSGGVRALCWSPSGKELIVGNNTAPYGMFYRFFGTTMIQFGFGGFASPGTVNSVGFSQDGKQIVLAHNNSPYLTTYDWPDVSSSIPSLKFLINYSGTGAKGIAWSPSNDFLLVATATAPYVWNLFKTRPTIISTLTGTTDGIITDVGTVSLPATYDQTLCAAPINTVLASVNLQLKELAVWIQNKFERHVLMVSGSGGSTAGAASGCAWSPDGSLIAYSHATSPYFSVYPFDGATIGTKLTNPTTLPTGTGNCVAWSPKGDMLAVGHSTSPYLSIYSVSGSTLTKLSDPATLPTGTVNALSWSANGKTLAVAHTTSPYLTMYTVSGTTFTKMTNPTTLPAGDAYAVAFSPDNKYLAVGHDSSPYVTIYKTAATVPANSMLYAAEVP